MVYGIGIIICILCALLIGYASGYSTSERKNQAYIEATYPPTRDLIRMKFERDIGVGSANSALQVLQDPNDDYIFYHVTHDPTSLTPPTNLNPIMNTIYMADLHNIPNYLDINNPLVYYPSNFKPILDFPVPKENFPINIDKNGQPIMQISEMEILLLGLDEDKLVFVIQQSGYRDERGCNSFYDEGYKDSLYYIDIQGDYTQIPKHYEMTPKMKDYLIKSTEKCTATVERNFQNANTFYEAAEKK